MGWIYKVLDATFSLIERLERFPGGKVAMLALASFVGGVMSTAYGIWRDFDGLHIALLALGAFALLLVVFVLLVEHVLPWLQWRLGPPIRIEISGYGRETVMVDVPKELRHNELSPATQENWLLKFPMHILNTSKTNNVSLKFASFGTSGHVMLGDLEGSGSMDLGGIKKSLKPQEDTEARIVVRWFPILGRNGPPFTLVLVDRVSERIARVNVPGKYPPKKKR